jgi:hypothetical protein
LQSRITCHRKKEKGRKKKEKGKRKKEERKRKKEEGRRKKEKGKRKILPSDDAPSKMGLGPKENINVTNHIISVCSWGYSNGLSLSFCSRIFLGQAGEPTPPEKFTLCGTGILPVFENGIQRVRLTGLATRQIHI